MKAEIDVGNLLEKNLRGHCGGPVKIEDGKLNFPSNIYTKDFEKRDVVIFMEYHEKDNCYTFSIFSQKED